MEEVKTPEEMAEEYSFHKYIPNTKQSRFGADDFLAGYKAAQQWISVKERLPEHGIPVLVFDTLANAIELMSWDKIMEAFGTEDAYFVQLNEASHWMPLPKPPEE